MEQQAPRRRNRCKRPTHPVICLLWALITVLVVFNFMMVVKLCSRETVGETGSTDLIVASNLSSLDKNLVE